jgi:small subunit ribosomal protein S21
VYPNVDEKRGLVVVARYEESVDSLIKRFKKKINRSGILREFKNATFYEKPSEKKKRKRIEAAIRKIKDDQKINTKRSYVKNEKHQSNK